MGSDNYQETAKVRSVFSSLPGSTVNYNQTTGILGTSFNGDPTNGLYLTKTGADNQYRFEPPTLRLWRTVDQNTDPTFYNSSSQGQRYKINFLESSNSDGSIYDYRGGGDIDVKVAGLYIIGGFVNNFLITSDVPGTNSISLEFDLANNPNPRSLFVAKSQDQLYLYFVQQLNPGLFSFYFSPYTDTGSGNIVASYKPNANVLPYQGYGGFLIKIGSVVS